MPTAVNTGYGVPAATVAGTEPAHNKVAQLYSLSFDGKDGEEQLFGNKS